MMRLPSNQSTALRPISPNAHLLHDVFDHCNWNILPPTVTEPRLQALDPSGFSLLFPVTFFLRHLPLLKSFEVAGGDHKVTWNSLVQANSQTKFPSVNRLRIYHCGLTEYQLMRL